MPHSAPSPSSSALSSSKGSPLLHLRKAIEIASRSVRIMIVIGIITLLISFIGMEGAYQMIPHSPGIPASVRHVTCGLMAGAITYYSVWPALRDARHNLADLHKELRARAYIELTIDEAR